MSKVMRRSLYYILSGATTVLGITGFFSVSNCFPYHSLALCWTILFGMLTLGLSLSLWVAIFGFIIILCGNDPKSITHTATYSTPNVKLPLTAVIMPIFNEKPSCVFARLASIYESILSTHKADTFELFILSDTNDPALRLEEQTEWIKLCEHYYAHGKIFYRNRTENTARKSGNIADFCRRWGGRYEFMIVLDADSLMSGHTMIKMVEIMVAHSKLGILQAPPAPINQSSLFARILQFTEHFYGKIYAAGTAFWQLSDSNYWGHNAIIRVKAFAEHADLPKLPGHEPIGGEILSHDFVEAALLRKAGWEIWLAPTLQESYEELPSNIVSYAKRDRRWCQGNLQHIWFLLAKKIPFMSRWHFLSGIMSYLAAPLWLIFLALGVVEAYQLTSASPTGLGATFPQHLNAYHHNLLEIVYFTLTLLFIPKLLRWLLLLRYPKEIKKFGGPFALILSILLEIIFSALFAPILMLYRIQFIAAILSGHNIGWPAQQRENTSLSFTQATQAHLTQTIIGIGSLLAVYFFIPNLFWWFFPVLLGLVLVIPLSMLVSCTSIRLIARRWHLFCIPEEQEPSQLLKIFRNYTPPL